MSGFISLCFFLCVAIGMQANPFAISFPAKKGVSNEDCVQIQKQLRELNVEPLLRELYPENQGFCAFEGFLTRCSKGVSQTLIDLEKGHCPIQQLEKIGQGSNLCVVTCVPYDHVYPAFVRSLAKNLQTVGFNGYFLYRLGGFPNPTGEETQYVGVPYSFKIFMMLELTISVLIMCYGWIQRWSP